MQGRFITGWLRPTSPRPCDAPTATYSSPCAGSQGRGSWGHVSWSLRGTRVLAPGHTFSSAMTQIWDAFWGQFGHKWVPSCINGRGDSRAGRGVSCGDLGAQFYGSGLLAQLCRRPGLAGGCSSSLLCPTVGLEGCGGDTAISRGVTALLLQEWVRLGGLVLGQGHPEGSGTNLGRFPPTLPKDQRR